jgi:hypothetical protein
VDAASGPEPKTTNSVRGEARKTFFNAAQHDKAIQVWIREAQSLRVSLFGLPGVCASEELV